tara:strand:- start:87 stop:917 length:831 start_codon:yes stop_codon:yes gene_type:complete
MKGAHLATNMRKALAQNPNLLRTLIGMGLTLIILLSYAVYGATISTEYFIYDSDSEESQLSFDDPERYYDSNNNQTTWTWDVVLDGDNLTWINLSASYLSDDAVISISNAEGIYSHPDLGDAEAEEFSCVDSCRKRIEHITNSSKGYAEIISLTDPDPALRGTGTVYADSLEEATEKASGILETLFEPSSVRITVIENGNRDVNPSIKLTQVNEELSNIEKFEVDAATEFMWALAAVIGCFSMVLVPSFTVYFAARAKQKKVELKLEAAKDALEDE